MGLDINIWKINRKVENTKALRIYTSAANKLFQQGLKRIIRNYLNRKED